MTESVIRNKPGMASVKDMLILQDLAIMTGAEYRATDLGLLVENSVVEHLGMSFNRDTSVQGSEAKAIFFVIGMACSACVGFVEKAVKRLPRIKEAVVDVLNNMTQVMIYPTFVSKESIREAIEYVGFQAALIEDETNEKSIQVCRIGINGMTCTSCSSIVENTLEAFPGVQKVQVALATEGPGVQNVQVALANKEKSRRN